MNQADYSKLNGLVSEKKMSYLSMCVCTYVELSMATTLRKASLHYIHLYVLVVSNAVVSRVESMVR